VNAGRLSAEGVDKKGENIQLLLFWSDGHQDAFLDPQRHGDTENCNDKLG
jgi:hypothetical protein